MIKQHSRETRYLEFKSNYQDANSIGEYISSLSNGAALDNEDYGYLIFGVDDTTLDIKGTSFDPYNQKVNFRLDRSSKSPNQYLQLGLRQYLSPKINFEIIEFTATNGKRIVMFRIPAAKFEPVILWEELLSEWIAARQT